MFGKLLCDSVSSYFKGNLLYILVERPHRKSRPPSNPTIPASIPISPGPSLLSLEEAQARSRVRGESLLRRGSLDFNRIECKTNKENFSDITPKKRSWKGLFSRNKSVSNDLSTYGDERKMSLSTFKRRVSYDVGEPSGLSTPRSQSSFNLRELGPSEGNARPPTGKKGRKKKLEISSPLGIRTSSFISYVGGMSQLERTSTAPEIDLRQAAKAARTKSTFGKNNTDSTSTGLITKGDYIDNKRDNDFRSTLEVINDTSIDETGSTHAEENNQPSNMKEESCEKCQSKSCEIDAHVSKDDFIELNKLIVNCSNVNNGNNKDNSISPVDEKSLRNSMWIEKYDEIARTCSSAAHSTTIGDESNENKPAFVNDTRSNSSQSGASTTSISPRHRSTAEIRDSILNRGCRELQSKYGRNSSEAMEKRSQSVDLSSTRPQCGKRASCLSDSGVSNSNGIDGVLSIDWVPVMQRSLTNTNDYKDRIAIEFPIKRSNTTGCHNKGRISPQQSTSRPFSSYDNHPLPQNDDIEHITDHKAKNRPSVYDNLL